MLVLAVDTSGRHGSIALGRGDGSSFTVLEVVQLAGGSYSARLIPEAAALLARHNLERRDIDAFVAVSGPGSFTGLRVGLSTVKGLAEVMKRPIATVSMLEAVAASAGCEGRIIAALDAGRRQIFAGEYDIQAGTISLVRESLLSPDELRKLLEANAAANLISPDEAVVEVAGAHPHVSHITWPDAGRIAKLGYNKIRAGQTLAPEAVEANYIRRSDAEIFGPK